MSIECSILDQLVRCNALPEGVAGDCCLDCKRQISQPMKCPLVKTLIRIESDSRAKDWEKDDEPIVY